MKTCARGHTYTGDENYRARRGWCPVCFNDVQARYRASEKGKANDLRYRNSERGRKDKKRKNARTNARRIMAGGMYLGTCGFSVSETEAILDGSTD